MAALGETHIEVWKLEASKLVSQDPDVMVAALNQIDDAPDAVLGRAV